MGIHSKEMKLKEVIKLGSLYIFLTEEKGLGLEGTINCGEVNKYVEKLMED